MTFLLRNWKLIAGALLVLAFIGAILAYGHRQYERGVADAKQDMQAELERAREHQREVNEEISREHQDTVAALQSRVRDLSRRAPVRLCQSTNEVRGADPGGAADSAGDGSGLRAGADIGPELYRYGGQCEELRQQLIAIRAWQEKLRAP